MGKKMFGVSIRGGWVFLAAAVLTLLLATDVFAGSYADTYGMSASGIARGNAMTAIVDDWSSVFYNPAGLGKTKKNFLNNSVAVEEEVEEAAPEGGEPVEAPPAPNYSGYVSELGLNYFYTSPSLSTSNRGSSVTDPTSGLKFGAGTLGLVIDLNRFFKQPDIVSSARFGLGLGLIDKYLMRINDTY
ncbi:MAG: hypothetical protein PHY31_07425, partial [Smithellaceae bacterium]|nr:hypothetical protein [Smithellaceae bacterium]